MKSKVYINGETLHGEITEITIDRAVWRDNKLFLYLNGAEVMILGGYNPDQITFDKNFEASTQTTTETSDDLTAAIDVLLGVM